MAITTLLAAAMVGAPVAQAPVIFTIESKLYRITDMNLALQGKEIIVGPLKTENGPYVLRISGFDEGKLREEKGAKVIAAPTIRTLNEQRGELTTSLGDGSEASESWKISFVPSVPSGSGIDLDITVQFTSAKPERGWKFNTKSNLKPENPTAWLFTKDGVSYLQSVKVYRSDNQAQR